MFNLVKSIYYRFNHSLKRSFWFLLVFSMIISIFDLLSLVVLVPLTQLITGDFVDNFTANIFGTVIVLSKFNYFIVLICFFCVYTILRLFYSKLESFYCHIYGAYVANILYRNILYSNYGFFRKQDLSNYMTLLVNKVNIVSYQLFFPFFRLIASLTSIIAISTLLFFKNPQISFILGFIVCVGYLIIARLSKSRILTSSVEANSSQGELLSLIRDSFGSFKEIVISNVQEFFINDFKLKNDVYKKAQSTIQFLGIFPRIIIEPAFVLIVTSLFLFYNNTSSIIFVGYGFLRILPLAQVTFYNINTFKAAKPTFKEVLEIMKLSNNARVISIGDKSFDSLEMKNITITQGGCEIIKDFNFKIVKGDRIAIVGKSGAGKTTLVDFVMGLLDDYSGEIILDEQDLGFESFVSKVRPLIAHVKQDVFLSSRSLAENIAFNVPLDEIDFEKLNKVIWISGLFELVDNLPNRERSLLGDNGSLISGGQRQRIGIARALYSGRKFLIFDEATSALDIQTEDFVLQTIFSLNSDYTILFITHKMDITKYCNKVIKL